MLKYSMLLIFLSKINFFFMRI